MGRPRPTRGDTSCRSLLGESDRLWGMISHAHFQARATLGARGKLGKIPLFFVTISDGVSSVGKGGRLRRGGGRLGELLGDAGSGDPAYKGAAGSERRPYLEGAGSGDPAYRGRHRGGGFIWGAVGRCPMPADWVWGGPWDTVPTGVVSAGVGLTGAARGWVARGRRVGRPGLQGVAAYDRASRSQGRSNSIAEYEFQVGPPS